MFEQTFENQTKDKALQRPPMQANNDPYQQYGNHFIQSLFIEGASESIQDNVNLSDQPFFNCFGQMTPTESTSNDAPIPDALMFQNAWGAESKGFSFENTPEEIILQLDQMGSRYGGETYDKLIDKFFPLGVGFSFQGTLDANIGCFQLSDSGMVTVVRADSKTFKVENSFQSNSGIGAMVGQKNKLGKEDSSQEAEIRAYTGLSVQECYEFPLHNPALLVPMMMANNYFSIDLVNEFFSILIPSSFKSHRTSVEYGLQVQADALAEFKSQSKPELYTLCASLGLKLQSGVTVHFPDLQAEGPKPFEVTCAEGGSFTIEAALLLMKKFGLPREVLEQAVEFGASIAGTWTLENGIPETQLSHFKVNTAYNPQNSESIRSQNSIDCTGIWALDPDKGFDNQDLDCPNQIQFNITRVLDSGIEGQLLSELAGEQLERFGVGVHTQGQLNVTMYLEKSSIKKLWAKDESKEHIIDFIDDLKRVLGQYEIGSWATNNLQNEIFYSAEIKQATLRILSLLSITGSLKRGLIEGVGAEGELGLGHFIDIDLIDTGKEHLLKKELPRLPKGIGVGLG
jgi:hypothetical protein